MAHAKPDLRATLRAIAAGKHVPATRAHGQPVIEAASVKRHQAAFRAWERFAEAATSERHAGEPLAAPSATLTPLA